VPDTVQVNVSLPVGLVKELHDEAQMLGITYREHIENVLSQRHDGDVSEERAKALEESQEITIESHPLIRRYQDAIRRFFGARFWVYMVWLTAGLSICFPRYRS